ncbi:MAG: DUF2071 domain-containing protein [Planctomycetaceae bacterium]
MNSNHSDSVIDREAPTKRPQQKPAGYQSWRDLFFLHWSVPIDLIRKVIPEPLELDLYDGHAWLGIVPFKMRQVRPAWSPVIPFVSNFLETNVRTYVHYQGEPGVWFFSLDANATLATLVARYRWNLNYCRSQMSLNQQDDKFHWQGKRLWPNPERTQVRYEIQTQLNYVSADCQVAQSGTFEYFLAERYLLFTETKRGDLLRGQVHHQPYPLCRVKSAHYEGSLEEQLNLPQLAATPDHTLFSPGVDVEMFPLSLVHSKR